MKLIKSIFAIVTLACILLFASCANNQTDDTQGENNESAHDHTLVEYSARDPECASNGYLHHFKCDECGKAFSDSEAKNDISGREIIYAEGHKVVDNKCEVCGLKAESNLYYRGYKNSAGEFLYSVVSGIGKCTASDIILPTYVSSGGEKIPFERIDAGAFKDVKGVRSIYIPSTVKAINQNAFRGCADLEAVFFEDASLCEAFSSSVFQDCKKLEIVSFGNNSNLKHLGNSVFKGCVRLSFVDFGMQSKLEGISEYCFDSCHTLGSVSIPVGVKTVSSKAFSDCFRIRTLYFSDALTEIGDLAFEGCEALEAINLGHGVTKIGNYAFSGCASLSSVTIPAATKNIGSYAFEKCSDLTITLAKGVSTQNFNPYWNYYNNPVVNKE